MPGKGKLRPALPNKDKADVVALMGKMAASSSVKFGGTIVVYRESTRV